MTRALIPEVVTEETETSSALAKSTRPERLDDGERAEHVDPNAPVIGQWYWWTEQRDADEKDIEVDEDTEVDDDNDDDKPNEPKLVCVVKLGSNYARVSDIYGNQWRESFRTFHAPEYVHEPFADNVITKKINQKQENVKLLMGKVQEVTARLALSPAAALNPSQQTAALVRATDTRPVDEYKTALVKAKDEELPELFAKVEAEHKEMAAWMTGQLLPMKAQASGLKTVIGRIEDQIFNVELYAGLVETVTQVKKGKPASSTTPIHVFQRQHYMDEECLANYKAGGMEFENIKDFDKWLCRKDNLTRILPFDRTIVAFRVRRYEKARHGMNIFVQIELAELDRLTFLYIRNGSQVFRLNTEIDFGAELFPDEDDADLAGHTDGRQLYVKHSLDNDDLRGVVPERVYKQIVEDEKQKKIEHDKEVKEWEEKRGEKYPFGRTYTGNPFDGPAAYDKLTPDHVLWDDAMERVQRQIKTHNRLVIVLQGLLDRSPVMHPHPPWQLFTPEGFATALKLVYDSSKALPTGDPPDFKKYRAQLAAQIEPGSMTLGQEDFWAMREADKYNATHRRRHYSESERERYYPYGNPGPGDLAKVVRVTAKGARFEWMRIRNGQRKYADDPYAYDCDITVPLEELFNVSAYKPGDYKIFYNDPRTRADYLKWAPEMLTAEDFHAGKYRKGYREREREELQSAFDKEMARRKVKKKADEARKLREEIRTLTRPTKQDERDALDSLDDADDE